MHNLIIVNIIIKLKTLFVTQNHPLFKGQNVASEQLQTIPALTFGISSSATAFYKKKKVNYCFQLPCDLSSSVFFHWPRRNCRSNLFWYCTKDHWIIGLCYFERDRIHLGYRCWRWYWEIEEDCFHQHFILHYFRVLHSSNKPQQIKKMRLEIFPNKPR